MGKQSLTLGVVGTSNKENEYRLPIHPAHLPRLEPAKVRPIQHRQVRVAVQGAVAHVDARDRAGSGQN